jgi:hypothetical protein
VARHEALRSAFSPRDAAATGTRDPMASPFRVTIHDRASIAMSHASVEGHGVDDRAQAIARIAEAQIAIPFDYEVPPLLRARLVRVAADEHVLVLAGHHLIFDAWAFRVLRTEIEIIYRRLTGLTTDPLAALPIDYVDFAAWERRRLQGPVLDRVLSYWTSYWAQWEPHVLSVRQLSSSPAAADGPTGCRLTTRPLEAAFVDELRAFLRLRHSTLFAACLAALAVALHRRTGRERLAIWGHYANRRCEELERSIGWFATSHIVGLDLTGPPDVATLLGRVRGEITRGFAHQELPLPLLMRHLSAAAGPSERMHAAFDSARISLDVRTIRPPRPDGPAMTPIVLASGVAGSMALQVLAIDEGTRLSLCALYAVDQCTETDAARLLRDVHAALHLMATTPDARLPQLAAAIPD